MLVTQQPVLRKFWHAVMPMSALAEGPQPFTLLGNNIVLFLDASGQPAALRDRCFHRTARLSKGWCVDDQGKAYLDTPEALKAGEWLAAFSKVSPSEQSYDLCKASLKEGKIGMWWTGPWAIAGVEVWNAGCNSYYRSPSGRVVTQWPFTMTEFRDRAATIDPDEFEVGRR